MFLAIGLRYKMSYIDPCNPAHTVVFIYLVSVLINNVLHQYSHLIIRVIETFRFILKGNRVRWLQ